MPVRVHLSVASLASFMLRVSHQTLIKRGEVDEGQEGTSDKGKGTSGAWKDGGKESRGGGSIGGARFQGDRVWLTLCIWRPQLSQLSRRNGPSWGTGCRGRGRGTLGRLSSLSALSSDTAGRGQAVPQAP